MQQQHSIQLNSVLLALSSMWLSCMKFTLVLWCILHVLLTCIGQPPCVVMKRYYYTWEVLVTCMGQPPCWLVLMWSVADPALTVIATYWLLIWILYCLPSQPLIQSAYNISLLCHTHLGHLTLLNTLPQITCHVIGCVCPMVMRLDVDGWCLYRMLYQFGDYGSDN